MDMICECIWIKKLGKNVEISVVLKYVEGEEFHFHVWITGHCIYMYMENIYNCSFLNNPFSIKTEENVFGNFHIYQYK